MRFSIIIPAHNEEKFLPSTLECIHNATNYLHDRKGRSAEILVVDNASSDDTKKIARASGVTVVEEPVRGIARVRNTGANAATGDILIFIDADVLVPEAVLWRISQVMSDPSCVGGAVDTKYRPQRHLLKCYLEMWRILGRWADMAQGATQFCHRNVYDALGGYDESLYMGEDVDFYWRLRTYARSRGLYVRFIDDLRVMPSCRRFDEWPLWRTLLWTNPLIVFLFRRQKSFWEGWYRSTPR